MNKQFVGPKLVYLGYEGNFESKTWKSKWDILKV